MIILRPRKQVETVEYSLCWDYAEFPGAGLAFPCDEDGNLPPIALLSDAALANLKDIWEHPEKYVLKGIQLYRHTFWKDAMGRCECGQIVFLEDAIYNCCEGCGRFYNAVGQELSDPVTWGEETGESLSDILSPFPRDWYDW